MTLEELEKEVEKLDKELNELRGKIKKEVKEEIEQERSSRIWLTITNVRLATASGAGAVEVQVQGDASEAADQGPTWLKCKECTKDSGIKADKLYDKILEALQKNRKVRGKLVCHEVSKKLVIEEVEVQYQ